MRLRFATLAAVAALSLVTASTAQAGRYVVRWGDTLTWIAEAHGVSLHRLARMNHRDPYAVLPAGTVLRVPGTGRVRAGGGGRYTVQWGDTLTWIAARYHTGLRRLARMNGLRPYGVLLAGTTIRIPGAAGRSQSPSHRRSAPVHRRTRGWRGRYRVRRGDTLTAIAARFGVGIHRLAWRNGLRIHGILVAGRTLRVPAHPHARTPSSAAPAPWSVGWSIDHWSAHYGVDPHLVRAIAWQESGFNPTALSPAGAWGAMQVMPATWRWVERSLIGVPVARTPDGNVRVGVALLRHLLIEFGGNEANAVAAYYQGERATRLFGILPMSRSYVRNVLALRTRL